MLVTESDIILKEGELDLYRSMEFPTIWNSISPSSYSTLYVPSSQARVIVPRDIPPLRRTKTSSPNKKWKGLAFPRDRSLKYFCAEFGLCLGLRKLLLGFEAIDEVDFLRLDGDTRTLSFDPPGELSASPSPILSKFFTKFQTTYIQSL